MQTKKYTSGSGKIFFVCFLFILNSYLEGVGWDLVDDLLDLLHDALDAVPGGGDEDGDGEGQGDGHGNREWGVVHLTGYRYVDRY